MSRPRRSLSVDGRSPRVRSTNQKRIAEIPPDQPKNARVLQGMIERSNVEPVVEMTQMIEVMRAYQHSTETLNATDELMRKALQKLGDVKV